MKIKSLESLKSPLKSASSSKSKATTKIKDQLKEEYFEEAQDRFNFEFSLTNNEDQTFYNELNLSNSMAMREKHTQNHFFDIVDFDKLGSIIN